jgi:hypothetical protein
MENTQQASILKLRGLKNKDMFLPIFDTISINSRTNTGGDVFRELWIMIFQMFGVEWVMPKRVVDLLVCWYRGLAGMTKLLFGMTKLLFGMQFLPSYSGAYGEQ